MLSDSEIGEGIEKQGDSNEGIDFDKIYSNIQTISDEKRS